MANEYVGVLDHLSAARADSKSPKCKRVRIRDAHSQRCEEPSSQLPALAGHTAQASYQPESDQSVDKKWPGIKMETIPSRTPAAESDAKGLVLNAPERPSSTASSAIPTVDPVDVFEYAAYASPKGEEQSTDVIGTVGRRP